MTVWNNTKIIATLGPSSNTGKMIEDMIVHGVDVFRLNGAHGTPDEHKETIRLIKNISAGLKIPSAILMDLPGPKIRVGRLKTEPLKFKCGDIVEIAFGKDRQTKDEIPIPLRGLNGSIKRGTKIYLNDGIIELVVDKVAGNRAICRVKNGGEISSGKGVNLPNAALKIPSLTQKDRALLNIALGEGVDYIGLSFVRSADDVAALKEIIKKSGVSVSIIAKIEKPEALRDLDEIITMADAIMIARGDLGIEIRHDKLPAVQRSILKKCLLKCKPSITATQMLESMVRSKVPTRAEASDIAMAVWEGTDALMLSSETSIGKFPLLAVKEMVKIAREAERHMPKIDISELNINSDVQAITRAAVILAQEVGAKAIVTPTRTGRTALYVSNMRPPMQIIAPTEDPLTARKMSLYWGVRPFIMPEFSTVDELLIHAERLALASKIIKKGDKIVTTSGAHGRKGDATRLIEVRIVGEK